MRLYRLPKLLISAVSIFAATLAFAEPDFVDGFESGTLETTGADGFSWKNPNRTSVVTADAVVWTKNGGASIDRPSGRDWNPYEGAHSLRFRYPSGQNMTEQRFDLGKVYDELWISYWLRVPINFTHGTSNPTNNKLLALWMDGYEGSGNGGTAAWEFWNDGNGGSELAVRYTTPSVNENSGHMQKKQFIRNPSDRGRWMRIVLHVKPSSTRNSTDGVLELWRKWEGSSAFQKLHGVYDARMPRPLNGPQGFNAGYLMGWSNPTYSSDTEWLMDLFKVSGQPFADGPSQSQAEEVASEAPVLRP